MTARFRSLLENNDALLLLVSLVQALLLLGLYDGLIKNGIWPAGPDGSDAWLVSLFTIALSGPTLLLLALEPTGRGRVFGLVLTFTGLAAALGYYAGSQIAPPPYDGYGEDIIAPFVFLLLVAAFKALMYVQHFAGDRDFSYRELFRRSWRNFIVFGLSALFAGAFRAVLFLWESLFAAIGIGFFQDLFQRSGFIIPAMTLAFGAGVVILRRQSGVIDTVAAIQQALMRLLLPLLGVVSLSFLAALPFTGLTPLWESGGSLIVLWVLLLTLFFVNGVYKDDPSLAVYPLWVHRLVYVGVAMLPVYSAISCYGLSLRVMQYGWSVDRCFAFLLWGLLTLFALGYCFAVLRRGDGWLRYKDWINVRMGLVVLATVLTVNSPLLDFRKLSVASQMARLQANGWDSAYRPYDTVRYLSMQGRPGYEALQALRDSVPHRDPDTAAELTEALDDRRALAERLRGFFDEADQDNEMQRYDARIGEILEGMGLSLTDADTDADTDEDADAAPRSLAGAVYGALRQQEQFRLIESEYHLLTVDMDADGETEYLLVREDLGYFDFHGNQNYSLLYLESPETGWHTELYTGPGDPATINRLLQGDFTITPQRWHQIEVGDVVISP